MPETAPASRWMLCITSSLADAIRRIVQAAYRDLDARCAKAAASAWAEAPKRFTPKRERTHSPPFKAMKPSALSS